MMKMKQEADGNVEVSEGKLVWYNERKGYGFVRIGDEEVFLHRSTLDLSLIHISEPTRP